MAPLSLRQIVLSSIVLSAKCISAQGGIQEPVIGDEGNNDDSQCHNACTALVGELAEITHYGPSSDLQAFSEGFFSASQREVVPACVVTPQTATQVSETITLLRNYPCPLAVKSGGHGISAGLSNVAGGITIDLRLLNQIEYLGAKDWDGGPIGESYGEWKGEITRIGPGARWGDVYAVLETLGRSVAGGRDASVGVGGFVMGGGISFISHKYGWAADTIRNFQLVLPNGTLTNVNHATNPSLFSALRGGGTNFGIVTRFDMETFHQPYVWGGFSAWLTSPVDISARQARLGIRTGSAYTFDKLTHFDTLGKALLKPLFYLAYLLNYGTNISSFVSAFESVILSKNVDIGAHVFMSFFWLQSVDAYLLSGHLVHTETTTEPKIFSEYKKLKSVWSNAKVTNVSTLASTMTGFNPHGIRNSWRVQTIHASPRPGSDSTMTLSAFLDAVFDIYMEETHQIKHILKVAPALTFHSINKNEIKHFQKNDGNALGIEGDEGPLIIIQTTTSYHPAARTVVADDIAVRTVSDNMYNRIRELAKKNGMDHRFQYMNYAETNSDVYAGVGEANREWLRGVKKSVVGKERWDIGGFKI